MLTVSSLRAENWMARLPDKAYVATLSIPGTHDTATGSGWDSGYAALGDMYARTQDLNIAEQWSAGVRAFDLRPSAFTDHLNLNHGIMATVLHFDKVLEQLRDSLIANPSEFVIIHIRHECEILFPCLEVDHVADIVDDGTQLVFDLYDIHLAFFDLREIEDVVDDGEEIIACAVDVAGIISYLLECFVVCHRIRV